MSKFIHPLDPRFERTTPRKEGKGLVSGAVFILEDQEEATADVAYEFEQVSATKADVFIELPNVPGADDVKEDAIQAVEMDLKMTTGFSVGQITFLQS